MYMNMYNEPNSIPAYFCTRFDALWSKDNVRIAFGETIGQGFVFRQAVAMSQEDVRALIGILQQALSEGEKMRADFAKNNPPESRQARRAREAKAAKGKA